MTVHNTGGGRVFYTSLGGVDDFQNETFQTLIVNALFWAAGREVAEKAPTEKPGVSRH